jgi:hypothetical protein
MLQIDIVKGVNFKPRLLSNSTTGYKFKQLASQWKADTAMLSDLSQKVIHPAYQRIIGMGPDVIPLLLQELNQQPNHWFWALRAITGANPVKSENRGRIKRMAQDWLDWGHDHGYKW